MISESVASLFSVCATAIISAIGAITSTSTGISQAGEAQEGQDGLALAGHQVDAAQRLRNPDHAGEAGQDHRERRQRRAENIAVDRPHRYRTDPHSMRAGLGGFRPIPVGIPGGRAVKLFQSLTVLITIPLIRQQNGWRRGALVDMVNYSLGVVQRPRSALGSPACRQAHSAATDAGALAVPPWAGHRDIPSEPTAMSGDRPDVRSYPQP